MYSHVLQEDIESTLGDPLIRWASFRDAAVLVTGGTGTIGSALARTLSAAGVRYDLNMRIIVHGRSAAKAAALKECPGVEFVGGDICEPLNIPGNVSHIFHCAALAKSPDMAANPVGVADTSVTGTKNALTFAKDRGVKSVVFLSSMEVYGETDPTLSLVGEEDLGKVDLGSARSCYPEAKRMAECLCACFLAQYGVPVKVARLAQTFGAGSSRDDTIVAIQFARHALEGEDITLHTEGGSRGNFCYLADGVRALVLLLLDGKNGEAYNIVNPEASLTIREMAELVAERVCGGRVSVRIQIPADFAKRGYAPPVTRKLSAAKLFRLGWRPMYGLATMYERTLRHWRESD